MLRGLKVLDLSRYLPGPFASMRLVEMGADVIKLEGKPYGDPARQLSPLHEGTGALFLACNRGKKSIAINLRTKKGIEIVQKLMCEVDVVMESYRPGVADRIGIGYEQAKALNPGLIYCSLSGYGQQGELSNKAGHDINYVALSGVLYGLNKTEVSPAVPDVTIADLAGGMAAVEGILAAYIQRLKTGEGVHLDISITDTLSSWQFANSVMQHMNRPYNSLGEMLRQVVSYQIYETKDHRHMALGALEKKFWTTFCKAVGKEDWIPFGESPAVPGNAIYEEVKALFHSQDYNYWKNFSSKLDACLTPVVSTAELPTSSYVMDRKLCENDRIQTAAARTLPPRQKGGESSSPQLGQHTREVLSEWLRLSPEEVLQLEKEGII